MNASSLRERQLSNRSPQGHSISEPEGAAEVAHMGRLQDSID